MGELVVRFPRFFVIARQQEVCGRINRVYPVVAHAAEIQSRGSEPDLMVARRIAEWMKGSGGRIWFGSGQRSGSMGVTFTNDGVEFYPIILWTYGRIEIQFQWMKGRPFFDEMENRRELMRRLNEIDGVNISDDDLTKRPSIPLSVLSSNPSNTEKFMDTLNWVIDRYRSAKPAAPIL